MLNPIVDSPGKVLKGYGRGSRQLGFPTANLPQFDKHIEDAKLLNGVYCGWSKLFINKNEISSNQRNYIAKPCVINIGISPTFVGKENPVRIIEVYLMSDDNNENNLPKDFYGNTLRLFITTFMRPEWKFTSIASLIEQINTDVQNAKSILRENSSSPIIDKEINHWIMNCDHLMTENEKVDSIFWKEVPISNMN